MSDRQAMLRKMMREKATGINSASRKEKYKMIRKLKAMKRAEQQKLAQQKAMPPPLPRKLLGKKPVANSAPSSTSTLTPTPAPTPESQPVPSSNLPQNFFDNNRVVKPVPLAPTEPKADKDSALASLEAIAARTIQSSQAQPSQKTTQITTVQNTVSQGVGDIPSGFFDDPRAEMKARGISYDFTNELSSFSQIIEDEQKKREEEEKEIEQKLKTYREQIDSTEAEQYKDTVSKMKRRAEEFKKRMAKRKKKKKSQPENSDRSSASKEPEEEIDPDQVDALLEDIAWRGKTM